MLARATTLAIAAAFSLLFAAIIGVQPAYAVGEDIPAALPYGATHWSANGGAYEGWVDGDSVVFGWYYGQDAEVEIPDTVEAELHPEGGDPYTATLTINTLRSGAFSNRSDITSVTLPDSLEKIGAQAFLGCTSLRTVTFEGEELAYISDRCFEGCTSLTSFTVPTTVTEIGEAAFADCTALASVTIKMDSPALTVIGKEAFRGCSALTQITIPRTVTHIMAEAFSGCSSLAHAYFRYADLSQLDFIGDEAFLNCAALKEIELPFKYPGVGDGHKSTIGDHVFYGCTGLEKAGFRNVPAPAVHGRQNDCFSQCSNLKFIIVKADILPHVQANGLGLPTNATVLLVDFIGSGDSTSLEIWKIYTDANWGKSTSDGSVDLVIPKSFITYPFTKINRCAAFTPHLNGDQEQPYAPDSYGQNGLRTVSFEEGCQITSIGEYAFMKCQYLESVVIPPNVTTIGQMAFMQCDRLASVDFQTTQITEIPFQCFKASGLTSVTLPEGVQYIGGQAFAQCGRLSEVYFPKSLSGIYDSTFMQCEESIVFYMPDTGNEGGVDHSISFLRDKNNGQYMTDSGYFWDAPGFNRDALYVVTCGSWFEQKMVIEKGVLGGHIVYAPVDISEDNTSVVINVDTSNPPVFDSLPKMPVIADTSTRWYHTMTMADFEIDFARSSCTNAGTATVVLKGDGERFTGERTVTFRINRRPFNGQLYLSGVEIPEGGFYWDDLQWTPEVASVYFKNLFGVLFDYYLTAGTDYTISYGTNIDAGEKGLSVTVNAVDTGNFEGTQTFYYDINPRDLSQASVSAVPDQYYTGDEVKPSPKVTLTNRNGGEIPLSVRNGDYTLDYVNNVNPGPATIVIKAVDGSNVTGSTTASFNIIPVDLSDEDLDIDPVDDQEYTGSAIEPDLDVWTPDGDELEKGKAYNVTWKDNVNVGTATATLTGIAPYSSGSADVTFEIVPKPVTITVDNASKGRGEADPVFTGTVEGLVHEGDLGEIKYVRTNNDEALGTYVGVLDATYTANPNYDVTVVKGDFTIGIPDYSVRFNANVPATASTTCSGTMEDQRFAYDEKKALSANGYSLPGYEFTGWNTKADGSGMYYANGVEVESLTDWGGTVTLYAQWRAKSYDIMFYLGEIGGNLHIQTAYFDQPGTLEAYSDEAFGWDSGGRTLHGWAGAGFGSFYEDSDDFCNLCGTPDTDGNVSDVTLTAEWVYNGQIVVTVTKDGVPQEGLEDYLTLVQDDATFSVPMQYEHGIYVFDPSSASAPGAGSGQLPQGEYMLRFAASGYPEAAAYINYRKESAATAVFDFCTVSLANDSVCADFNNVEIEGGEPVAGAPNTVIARDGDYLNIKTTVAEGYRFEGYTAVGVAPVWDPDPYAAEQTIQVQGKADISAHVSPIDYSVTVEGGTADKATAHVGDTVTITADEPAAGMAFAQWAHVDGVDFANPSSTSTTFTMPAKDVTATAVYAPIVIEPIADKVYTGSAIEPADEVVVSLEGVDLELTADDYEVSFEDNVNAGDAKVIVTMKSPRAGSATFTFKINPADISEATVTATDQVYDSTEHEPDPTVTCRGRTLEAGKDYEVTDYADNKHAGTATVTVKGKGNFKNSASGPFAIAKAPLTITVNDQTYVYNGYQQGEGDTAYEDPAEIAEKITVEGLQGSDAITSLILDGAKTDVGVYEGEIEVTGFTIGEATDDYDVTLAPGTLTIKQKAYEVTFVDDDGTVLQSGQVAYGEMPKYAGATLEKAATAQYTYAFAGWSPKVAKVTGDATYTATYSSTVNEYMVKFVNEDGTELQSGKVAYGQTPKYAGATPAKAADAQYAYEFAGWSPEVAKVTGDATYTATYDSTVNTATLTFDLAGGELDGKTGSFAMEANVGETVSLPAAPTREGFSFACWSGQGGAEHEAGAAYEVAGDSYFAAKWVEDAGGAVWERLAGANRLGTMREIVAAGYPDGAPTVLLTTCMNDADALSAAGLSALLGAPLVSTVPGELSEEAREAISSLGAEKVIILGGERAVSPEVEKQLKAMGLSVERLAGDTRVETALEIYRYGQPRWGSTCFISKGWQTADALSAGSAAFANGAPIFFTMPDGSLDPQVAAAVRSFDRVVVLGGTGGPQAVRDAAVEAQGVAWMRIAGETRYETAVELARWATGECPDAAFQPERALSWDGLALASSMDHSPDALVGVNVTGTSGSVTLLVSAAPDGRTRAVVDAVAAHAGGITRGWVLGGTAAIGDDVAAQFEQATK